MRLARPRPFRAGAAMVVAAACATTVAGLAAVQAQAAAPSLAGGVAAAAHHLDPASLAGSAAEGRTVTPSVAGGTARSAIAARAAGVPASGPYTFLVQLKTASTSTVQRAYGSRGTTTAAAQARAQLATVDAAQNQLIARLPRNTSVLYRMHAALSAVAVRTDARNYSALQGLAGVAAVYPVAPKKPTNSYAVPFQGGAAEWQAFGNLGAGSTVAIIDTGIDYTHVDFGGKGTATEYARAKAQKGKPINANEFPGPKVAGGYDLVGDAYDADPNSATYDPTPKPDAYPLDCNGHGSHVAGTVAGYGVTAAGTKYSGPYDQSTPFSSLRIGPGMAPAAKLLAIRVFGCTGSTDVIGEAIDRAIDPNGDGDTSDHADVANLSLGADFGSPLDGDSVAVQGATQAGVVMAIASGNAGDVYDIGGSPGDAPSALTVAASQDAQSVVDALKVTAPAAIAGTDAAERSIAYDWAGKPDLSGTVVKLTDSTNLDGCSPLSKADAAAVSGKVAFLEWTDDDSARRCGSVGRSGNVAAAGAVGFVFGSDDQNFAAGITGSSAIPGVLVNKAGADAIRSQLAAGTTVTVGGTVANGFTLTDTGLNDTLADFSSRGIHAAGNVKPDVAAVGATVFSAAVGTRSQGVSESGTSMATPMVAGLSALITAAHPTWTVEQVKADVMNTADADVYAGQNRTGAKYAPNRVGAGRIDVLAALKNSVVAYTIDGGPGLTDNGSVSASFGSVAAVPGQGKRFSKRTIRVENLGTTSKTYEVTYEARTSVPGVTYEVSPGTVTVAPGSSADLKLKLIVDPTKLTKTIDPTVADSQLGVPREFQADASGLVRLKASGTVLRVPVYAAPRPASAMSAASSLTLPSGSVQQALLPLKGTGVNQGSGAQSVQSLVAGFELQATSGVAPACSAEVVTNCVPNADGRAADLKYVGTSSTAPQVTASGQDPLTSGDGLALFAISTQAPWRTAASTQEFDVYVDTDGDKKPDVVVYNTRVPFGTGDLSDVQVAETVDLATGSVLDLEPLDARFGDTDAALFDSDTLILPVGLQYLPGITKGASRINYAVVSFSASQSAPVDGVGSFDSAGNLADYYTFDVLNPGVAVYGSYDAGDNPVVFRDAPGSVLALRRDSAAYATDHGQGALIVHLHNQVGAKAQVVSLT